MRTILIIVALWFGAGLLFGLFLMWAAGLRAVRSARKRVPTHRLYGVLGEPQWMIDEDFRRIVEELQR